MRKIGFKWGSWDSWTSSTESKWEKSYYGGFKRLISDHPRVVVDRNVDFDLAVSNGLSYYEKEKILKIFLSKAKSRELISVLMRDAETITSDSFLYGKVIKTIINKNSKELVISILNNDEKEYAPLFNHYKDLILDSEIYFEKPEKNSSGKGGNVDNKNDDKEKSESNQDQHSGKEQNNDDSKQNNQNADQDKSESDKKQNDDENKSNQSGDKNKNQPDDESILNSLIAFEKALRDITEEEYVYDSISAFNRKSKISILPSNDFETRFTHGEKNTADRLTKMLDISFDPTHDIVKNLRLGKLDIAKIAEVPAGNIAIYKQSIEDQTTKPFSVVILCDESGSMGSSKLQSQYRIVKSLYLSFSDILHQEKIFVYGHSGCGAPELFVYQDPYNQNFLNTIDLMLSNRHEQNYDGPIIEEIYKSVRATTSDRIIFIILSDGNPCGHGYGGDGDLVKMKQIIEKCKRDDFVTIGVGIQHHARPGLYQYSTVVDDLDDMPKKVSHIVNHVVKTEFQ